MLFVLISSSENVSDTVKYLDGSVYAGALWKAHDVFENLLSEFIFALSEGSRCVIHLSPLTLVTSVNDKQVSHTGVVSAPDAQVWTRLIIRSWFHPVVPRKTLSCLRR